jgi:hypothetical protein
MVEDERCGLYRRFADRFGEKAGDTLYAFFACVLAIAVHTVNHGQSSEPLRVAVT